MQPYCRLTRDAMATMADVPRQKPVLWTTRKGEAQELRNGRKPSRSVSFEDSYVSGVSVKFRSDLTESPGS